MTKKDLTIDSTLKLSKSALIINLINAGVPAGKVDGALQLMTEVIVDFMQEEVDNDRLKNLILLLTGYSSDDHLLAPVILNYSLALTSSMHIDHNEAREIAMKVVPIALQSIGDHLAWSNLNKEGISSLINQTKKSTHQGTTMNHKNLFIKVSGRVFSKLAFFDYN